MRSAESGDLLYAFLESDTNVARDNLDAQREFILDRAEQADLPADAGVIVVAPDEQWSQVYNLSGDTEQDVYGAMAPTSRTATSPGAHSGGREDRPASCPSC